MSHTVFILLSDDVVIQEKIKRQVDTFKWKTVFLEDTKDFGSFMRGYSDSNFFIFVLDFCMSSINSEFMETVIDKYRFNSFITVILPDLDHFFPAEYYRSGVDFVLVKPINTDDLEKSILYAAKKKTFLVKLTTDTAAAIGHELKNHMTGVNGYIELLTLHFENSGERKEMFLKLQCVVHELNMLIKSLLTGVSYQNSCAYDHFTQVNVKEIIDSVLTILEPAIQKKKLKVFNKLSPFFIDAEPVKLKMLFVNLLLNAITNSPDNSEITFGCCDRRERTMFISDNGCGIADEFKESVFERRFRVHSSYSGYGLGLYAAKDIVMKHGGEIWVEDNIPCGTVFKIFLPPRRNENCSEKKKKEGE